MSSGRIKSYKTVSSETSELNQVQNRLKQVFSPILKSEIINGVLLKNIPLKATQQNLINHKLSRKSQGFLIVDKDSNANIWRLDISENLQEQYLDLRCNADTIVSIWIF